MTASKRLHGPPRGFWRFTSHEIVFSLIIAVVAVWRLLISPHVQTYDAILLAPAVLWLTQWALQNQRPHLVFVLVVLSVFFLMPIARIAGIPLTIPLLMFVLWDVSRSQRAVVSAS